MKPSEDKNVTKKSIEDKGAKYTGSQSIGTNSTAKNKKSAGHVGESNVNNA